MAKMPIQKIKYLENKESFYDEMKNIFHHFYSAFIEANKVMFFDGESLPLKAFHNNDQQ